MQAKDATLSQLAEELDKAKTALAVDSVLGLPRGQARKWKAYKRDIEAEIDRRSPVNTNDIDDTRLMAELEDLA